MRTLEPFFFGILLVSHHFGAVESFVGPLKTTSKTRAHVTAVWQTSSEQQQQKLQEIFPVLSRVHGINWTGTCRYVNAELQPQTNLLLTGSVRYDLELKENDPVKSTASCTLTSFLTFPNGKTRQVEMVGERSWPDRPSFRLDPPEEGPIYMVLTEVLPDTVLLNEVDKASGRTILTASLSIPKEGQELIQVSHEVGDGDMPIEGHQVWRLQKTDNTDEQDDRFRGTTGR